MAFHDPGRGVKADGPMTQPGPAPSGAEGSVLPGVASFHDDQMSKALARAFRLPSAKRACRHAVADLA